MASTTTKIVKELDGKSGDGWTLSKFEDAEGKKFQTFDDDIAAQVRSVIGQEAVIEFEVETSNRSGRTFASSSSSSPPERSRNAAASPVTSISTARSYGRARAPLRQERRWRRLDNP